ncbi:MAG: N-acetyltransferase [Nitrospinota bacterium]
MIRKAKVQDGRDIVELVNYYGEKGVMLPRSLNEIYETIREFLVYEEDGKVLGVASVHIDWEDLAEIRSLAVQAGKVGRGIGADLVRECIQEAQEMGINRVFSLTYVPEFFMKLGFEIVDKSMFPHKIWGDCVKCPKFPECDETALIYNIDLD